MHAPRPFADNVPPHGNVTPYRRSVSAPLSIPRASNSRSGTSLCVPPHKGRDRRVATTSLTLRHAASTMLRSMADRGATLGKIRRRMDETEARATKPAFRQRADARGGIGLGRKVTAPPNLRSGSDRKVGVAFSVTVHRAVAESPTPDRHQILDDLGPANITQIQHAEG